MADKEIKGEIELPGIDVRKYVGKVVPIETFVQKEGDYKGKKTYYVLVKTVPLDILEGKEGKIEIRAGRIFNLVEDKDGKLGWGKDTKLGVFLKKYHLKTLKDMKGTDVIVTLKPSKNGKEFLGFE
jgi:hypothetical protein